jgi:uncharacterized membrane-anchored protein YitT (DUF2179 family)
MTAPPPERPTRLAALLRPTESRKHTWAEDALAFAIGVTFIALGLALLQTAGLATGGIAGIALIAHFATGQPVGLLFLLINVPFYALAWKTMGLAFTLRTLVVNLMLASLGAALPRLMTIADVDPIFAACAGGILLGMGVLALARHRASVGGISALAIFAQERGVMRAGHVQALTDCLILVAAATVLDARAVLLSIFSALVVSAVLVLNHKPGRYTGL